jgi:ribosome-associated heat shock protein Hsp15
VDRVRVDRWLWAIRIYPSRTEATAACRAGHVKVNGTTAKPAVTVGPGDRVVARAHGRHREVEVVETIDKRVGAAAAADCYVDHTLPDAGPRRRTDPVAAREPGTGRPTKRERRQIDRWRHR